MIVSDFDFHKLLLLITVLILLYAFYNPCSSEYYSNVHKKKSNKAKSATLKAAKISPVGYAGQKIAGLFKKHKKHHKKSTSIVPFSSIISPGSLIQSKINDSNDQTDDNNTYTDDNNTYTDDYESGNENDNVVVNLDDGDNYNEEEENYNYEDEEENY